MNSGGARNAPDTRARNDARETCARNARPKRRAFPKTRFSLCPRDDPLQKREFCRTLFILLENDPETYTVPEEFSSESYLKETIAQVALGAGRRGVRSRSNKPQLPF